MNAPMTPTERRSYLSADELRQERREALSPRVLADLRDTIRAAIARPNSDIDALTRDAYTDTLMLNMMETLIRMAARNHLPKSREAADEDLGRAFRSVCERAIDYAAREGLDAAVDARMRREDAEAQEDAAVAAVGL